MSARSDLDVDIQFIAAGDARRRMQQRYVTHLGSLGI